MTSATRHLHCELAVIGSGIAGFAASIFATNRRLSTAQVGNTGAIAYTTGYLDLLGAISGENQALTDPWQGLVRLRNCEPNHPLSSLAEDNIRQAFSEFTDFVSDAGILYTPPADHNITALTPAGTLKQTLCVPATMAAGPRAFQAQNPCLIIDFKGLKGFSGRQVVANLKDHWPGLSCRRLTFPGMERGELYPEVMARALEVPAIRRQLAELLRQAAAEVTIVGLPAVLGMHNPDLVHRDLEQLTGLTIFEIPTMPPSVPGIRLRELFEQLFPQRGLTLVPQQKVDRLHFTGEGALLELADNFGPITIEAKAVILATGRFLSGGLQADVTRISEPLLDLPVSQPASRAEWYRDQYTDRLGHPIHQAGIEIDLRGRPLDRNGEPVNPRLFAAGVILAHQDWIRGRSGAGIAIATAFRAVTAAEQLLRS